MSKSERPALPNRVIRRMAEGRWNENEIRVAEIFYSAHTGDMLRWADRRVPMEVVEIQDGETRELRLDKPKGDGTHYLRERWKDGVMKPSSNIGTTEDLELVESNYRGLSEGEVERLSERLTESAIDSFLRLDYEDWERAVADVVEDWSERVSLRNWRGYRNHPDWQDGDPEAIFRSVVDHIGNYAAEDDSERDSLSERELAEVAMTQHVLALGREQAESSIVTNEKDYRELVDTLAHHTVDRIDRKNYADAKVAVRDTISDWIDDRRDPAYQSIIEYGTNPYEDDLYADDDTIEDEARERAFDILDAAVWDEVSELQRERGEHDPTLRGMTRDSYEETVDVLAGRTLRRWRGEGFLRTTAKEVVSEWADRVENEKWDGHRHDIYADGDVEDIFSSATIHSTTDPFVWNPFASDKERRMAEQALLADVVSQAEDTYDETQPETDPIPANEYLNTVLEVDTTYDELKESHPEEIQEVISRIIDAANGSEVGWTFVDEILEAGGMVPEATNDWILVDYGVIREGEQLRKLAWFDRGTGDVLLLSGMANETPRNLSETEEPYDEFHVVYQQYNSAEPEFVCESVDLEEGLECVYDYIDGNKADIRVIETREQDWVQEQITEEDINAGGVVDALVPNLPWGSEDILTVADDKARGAARFTIRDWAPEIAKLSSYVVVAWAPRWIGQRLEGIRVEPNIHKRHGVGTRISKEFGKAPYESGVGGKATIDLNVRPSTFSDLGERYAPNFVQYGVSEGDIGKGAVRAAGESAESLSNNAWGAEFLDEFGGSIESFISTLQEGAESGQEERLKREFLADFYDKPEEEVDVDEEWEDLSDEVKQGYYQDVIADADFSWDEFERQDLGISGMLMRGLDAEGLVKGAEFLNIDEWLQGTFTFYGGDYVEPGDAPTFEEWKQDRFGAGQPAGPEEEARLRARFHKEVAAADLEAADPFDALGIDEQMVEERSDYDQAIYDFDQTFGETFDDVADPRTSDIANDMADEEFERSIDNVDES